MKKALILMALVATSLSTQVHARSEALEVTSGTTALPFLSTIMTRMVSSDYNYCKEANQIIADGQEYAVTGELAPYLAENVKGLQERSDLSVDEAVDLLMDRATEILK